jgi:hypothetical protein
MQSPLPPALRIVSDSFDASAGGAGGAGGGGVRSWTLVADEPTVAALRIELKRSWQPAPTKAFTITIDAKAR